MLAVSEIESELDRRSRGSEDVTPWAVGVCEGDLSGLRLARLLANAAKTNPRSFSHTGSHPAWSHIFVKKTKKSDCHVIVKIAEIVLTPENPAYDGGSWHVEGTDAERIVATGLYYFGCENITESRLSFRTIVEQPEYEQSDYKGVAMTFGMTNGAYLVQGYGSVTAMEDRCVVFPNILQHKVEPFRLEDPTKTGVRKILAFFLVDPTCDPIPSTAVVPPQQKEWVDRAQAPAVKKLRAPWSGAADIQDKVRFRMDLELAQEFRLELMDERSPSEDNNVEGLTFSLCEH